MNVTHTDIGNQSILRLTHGVAVKEEDTVSVASVILEIHVERMGAIQVCVILKQPQPVWNRRLKSL